MENLSPEMIDKACAMVCDKLGITWHKWIRCDTEGNHVDKGLGFAHICACGHQINSNTDKNPFHPCSINPPLATSLDAWAEHIWPMMTSMQIGLHWNELRNIINRQDEYAFTFELNPLHHLEAALKSLGLWEEFTTQ